VIGKTDHWKVSEKKNQISAQSLAIETENMGSGSAKNRPIAHLLQFG